MIISDVTSIGLRELKPPKEAEARPTCT